MILVLLGTQNNSFHRLLEEIDKLIEKKVINEKVIVQAGYTKYESKNMKIFALIPQNELNKYQKGIERLTASEYLEKHPPKEAIQIPESSWGQGGHFWVWQNHLTEWMWPIIHSCEKRISEIVSKYENIPQDKLLHRALNQLARENLLLQSSD